MYVKRIFKVEIIDYIESYEYCFFISVVMMQKKPMYEMHKYWGKKPSGEILNFIQKYSKEDQIVLDPFSGYGVIACEAFLNNRNVISNDLNPVSNFINENLFALEFDEKQLTSTWKVIKKDFEITNKKLFSLQDGTELVSILRNKSDVPLRCKYKKGKQSVERELTIDERKYLLEIENSIKNNFWFPTNELIENSRISAKKNMKVQSLFTKRELICLSKLFYLISNVKLKQIRSYLLFAFSANLANCSKLVPPIKSRGQMSQGAWMTGFYIGETYIENNVLHYFENRLKKIIIGKIDFIKKAKSVNSSYRITNFDCKNLKKIQDSSIDYVITDPPYGESVPYFEQSIIWNSWLRFAINFEDEIVISNSKLRKKDDRQYEKDINIAYSEIARVLKQGAFFTFTFHALSGKVWNSIIKACIQNNFEFIELTWLKQITFSPRQLNRKITPLGDLTITLKKSDKNLKVSFLENMDVLKKYLSNKSGLYDTNSIYIIIIEYIFKNRIIVKDLDIIKFLYNNYELQENKWIIK